MSPVGAGLDGLLALLLVATLVLGVRLNRRLRALRDSQAGFAAAVLELNQAAARAEAGLNALKTAQEDAHEALLGRIEVARDLAARLERAGGEAERRVAATSRTPDPGPHTPARPAGGALAAIAALAEGRSAPRGSDGGPSDEQVPADRVASPPPLRRSARGAFDEELFEAKGARRDDPFALGAMDRGPADPRLRPSRAEDRAAGPRQPPGGPAPAWPEAPLDLGPLADPLSKWKTVR